MGARLVGFIAFLCLAALYESWCVTFAVLLTVLLGIFGAFLFQYAPNLGKNVGIIATALFSNFVACISGTGLLTFCVSITPSP